MVSKCARSRLGVLASDPTNLHHGHARAVGEHHGHLQHGLELGADLVGVRAAEALGAVAAHRERTPHLRGDREPIAQLVALTGKHQRRQRSQLGASIFQDAGVRPLGLLRGRQIWPGQGVRHPPRVRTHSPDGLGQYWRNAARAIEPTADGRGLPPMHEANTSSGEPIESRRHLSWPTPGRHQSGVGPHHEVRVPSDDCLATASRSPCGTTPTSNGDQADQSPARERPRRSLRDVARAPRC